MIQILGYLAMICLITSAIPQVIMAVREGHSRGMAGGFILLTISGFTLMSVYLLLTNPVIPVLINYSLNTAMMLVIGYYKVFPRAKP